MKLELESLEYDREDSGNWTAKFTVRGDSDRQVLAFTEHCAGSDKGRDIVGWQQNIEAAQAMAKLFAQARTTLRNAGAAT